MVPATMKAIVPVSIVITSPIPTARVVVRSVVRRRIGERFDERDAGKDNSETDERVRFGGYTLSNSCDPESSS
jgi:hypothetical protein